MDKKLANKIAKEWNEHFAGTTEDTHTKAIMREWGNGDCGVDVYPTGETEAFHQIENLALIASYYKVTCFVMWSDYEKKVIGIIS